MLRGWSSSAVETGRELEVFSLQKGRLQGDLTAAFQYIKGAYRKAGEGLFIRECGDKIKSDSFKLKEI